MGSVSEIPHETRRAKWKKDVRVENNLLTSWILLIPLVFLPRLILKNL